jgi:hypothetical protein
LFVRWIHVPSSRRPPITSWTCDPKRRVCSNPSPISTPFTAGIDMPRFFGPKAEKWGLKEGNIDVFGLANRCRKPIVTAVQGIVSLARVNLDKFVNDVEALGLGKVDQRRSLRVETET